MRGIDVFQETLFTTVQLDSFIPADHPLRWIRAIIDQALTQIDWLLESNTNLQFTGAVGVKIRTGRKYRLNMTIRPSKGNVFLELCSVQM